MCICVLFGTLLVCVECDALIVWCVSEPQNIKLKPGPKFSLS